MTKILQLVIIFLMALLVFFVTPASATAKHQKKIEKTDAPFSLLFKDGSIKNYGTVQEATLDAVVYNGTHDDRCELREREKNGKWKPIPLPKDKHPNNGGSL